MSELLLKHFDLLAQAPDGVKRLRELILTLAVQGKLVPQDPNDEPASVLLERIRAEKERLIAEGTIKRDKPLPPIADEEKPFELPQGWEWARNAEIFSLRKGRNPKVLSEMPVGKAYLDIEALDRHQIRRYSEDVAAPTCTANDILVVCDGSRSGLVLQGKDGIVGSTLSVVETPGFMQPYVRLLFRAGYRRYNSGMKGAAIPHLDTKVLLSEVTGLPPLHEQTRIVARVEELMRLCDALEAKAQLDATQHAQLLQTLLGTLTDSASPEELAENWQRVAAHFDLLLDRPEAVDALEQTILQLAVRGLLVPQDASDEPASMLLERIRAEKDLFVAAGKIKRDKPLPPISAEEKPFELREGWEWVRVGDIVEMLNGYAFKSEWFKQTGVRLLRNLNISHGFVDWSQPVMLHPEIAKEYEPFALKAGDIVLSLDRPIISTGLKYAVVCESDLPCLLLQRVARLTPIPAAVSSEFLVLWLQSDLFMSTIDPGRSNGVPHISTKQVERLAFAVPPLAEQSRIVSRVGQLRQLCSGLRNKLVVNRSTQMQLADALVAEVA